MYHDMGLGAFANQPECIGLQQIDIEISRVVGLGLHPGTPYFPASAREFVADIVACKTLASCDQDALSHR
jgi:hypothetical protein